MVLSIFSKAYTTCLKKWQFQFFKSWRLAIELRLWWFQFSQKPALHASKTGLEFFQSRPYVHQNREVPFFKSRRHASQKAGLSIFEKPALHATMPPCNFEWCFFRAGFFDNIFLAIIPLSIYLLLWIFFAYLTALKMVLWVRWWDYLVLLIFKIWISYNKSVYQLITGRPLWGPWYCAWVVKDSTCNKNVSSIFCSCVFKSMK